MDDYSQIPQVKNIQILIVEIKNLMIEEKEEENSKL